MRRWAVTAALLLALGAAKPAWAGDREDCGSSVLINTDPVRVVAACRRLADQGVATAQHNLGTLYVRGRGVPHNYSEAATWFQKAANQGLAAAQMALGVLRLYGLGVTKDYVQAYLWFTLAATQGHVDAARDRENVAAHMTPAQIEQAKALVGAWKPTIGQ